MLFTLGSPTPVGAIDMCVFIYTNDEKPGKGARLPAILFTMILPPFKTVLLPLELLGPPFDCD
ncbi:hypothetical protein DERF_014771 [Dermatophagoides farinae]|uniref:Uncharacterized protein n=1 Tax=Dermatophagoides farinae TaxID=6954 RepID=A0A922KZI8_DERFA|nr:hypothetical protein DERF_014771 [Dermatophagoides farinae]